MGTDRTITGARLQTDGLPAEFGALLTALDALPDGAYIGDERCRIVYANPALESHFGPFDGRRCHAYLHGEDHPCAKCNNREIFSGTPSRQEVWFPHVRKHFDIIESLLPDVNGLHLKLALLRDITAQRETENALRDAQTFLETVMSSMGEGLIVLDMDLVYRVWNQRIEEMVGLKAEDVLGRKAIEVFPDLREKGVIQQMERALSGETVFMPDLYYETPGVGKRSWFTGTYTPHRTAKGEIIGLVIALSEVSHHKKVESAIVLRDRISHAFLTAEDSAAYDAVLNVVLETTGSEWGFLGHLDRSGSLVCPSLTHNVWERCRMPGKSIVFPRETWGGLWGRALIERKPLLQNDGLRTPPGHIHLNRAMCVPIVQGSTLLGLLSVANRSADYGPEDLDLLTTIAEQIAAVLRARMQRDEQAQARTQAEDALQTLRKRLTGPSSFLGIIGRTPVMQDLFARVREVASSDVPVVLQGESGSGKELVATAIHAAGPRADRPFVGVNCSALPPGLLESELFGHVHGAFTGAVRDKKGRFELADGGTLFLDEVGDLTPPVQVSLLRVLQERVIERVGDEVTRPIDVRVISASHRDLRKLVASGKFREDLFYRLCVIPIRVPPLRERMEDIPLLVDHILEQVAAESGTGRLTITSEALDALMAYRWPGNVRELQNTLHFARVRSRTDVLDVRHLPASVLDPAPAPVPQTTPRGRKPKLTPDAVRRVLAETGGNKAMAAARLGVSRTTLYRYLDAGSSS